MLVLYARVQKTLKLSLRGKIAVSTSVAAGAFWRQVSTMAFSPRVISAILAATFSASSINCLQGTTRLTRPALGRMPTTPFQVDGRLIEAKPSWPIARMVSHSVIGSVPLTYTASGSKVPERNCGLTSTNTVLI